MGVAVAVEGNKLQHEYAVSIIKINRLNAITAYVCLSCQQGEFLILWEKLSGEQLFEDTAITDNDARLGIKACEINEKQPYEQLSQSWEGLRGEILMW